MPRNAEPSTLGKLQALYEDELTVKKECRCAFRVMPEDVQLWLRKQVSLTREAGGRPRWRALANSLRKAEVSDLSPEALRFHFERHE